MNLSTAVKPFPWGSMLEINPLILLGGRKRLCKREEIPHTVASAKGASDVEFKMQDSERSSSHLSSNRVEEEEDNLFDSSDDEAPKAKDIRVVKHVKSAMIRPADAEEEDNLFDSSDDEAPKAKDLRLVKNVKSAMIRPADAEEEDNLLPAPKKKDLRALSTSHHFITNDVSSAPSSYRQNLRNRSDSLQNKESAHELIDLNNNLNAESVENSWEHDCCSDTVYHEEIDGKDCNLLSGHYSTAVDSLATPGTADYTVGDCSDFPTPALSSSSSPILTQPTSTFDTRIVLEPVLTHTIKNDNIEKLIFILLNIATYDDEVAAADTQGINSVHSFPKDTSSVYSESVHMDLSSGDSILSSILPNKSFQEYILECIRMENTAVRTNQILDSKIDLYQILLFSLAERAQKCSTLLLGIELSVDNINIPKKKKLGVRGYSNSADISLPLFRDSVRTAAEKYLSSASYRNASNNKIIYLLENDDDEYVDERDREKDKKEGMHSTQDPLSMLSYTININSNTFQGEINRMKEINFLLANNSRAKVTSAKVTSVMGRSMGLKSYDKENGTQRYTEVQSPYLMALEGGQLTVVESVSKQYPFYSFYELRSARGGIGILLMIIMIMIIIIIL